VEKAVREMIDKKYAGGDLFKWLGENAVRL
jgi:hypothetical protein